MDVFGLTTPSLKVTERTLDFVSYATMYASGNIANVSTPNYKARSVEFEGVLDEAMKSTGKDAPLKGGLLKTDPRHIPVSDINRLNPPVVTNYDGEKLDGNTVDIDREITTINEMDIKYSVYSDIAGRELLRLKSAISLTIMD